MSPVSHTNGGYPGIQSENAGHQSTHNQDMLFCPGVYSPSGFDMMKILVRCLLTNQHYMAIARQY